LTGQKQERSHLTHDARYSSWRNAHDIVLKKLVLLRHNDAYQRQKIRAGLSTTLG